MKPRTTYPRLSRRNWEALAQARLNCDRIGEAISVTRIQQAPLLLSLLAEIALLVGGLADACAQVDYKARKVRNKLTLEERAAEGLEPEQREQDRPAIEE